MKTYILIATLFLLGSTYGDDDLDTLRQHLPGIDNIDENALPQKEELEKAFKEKCEKNGGAAVYDDIMNSKDEVQSCFEKHINTTTIMEQLDVAKKNGSMDEVFGKYCKKRPDILGCIKSVTDKVEKCLEPSEKDNLKIVLNVTESLADFICFRDGDRLAMFVAEGGFECLQDHRDGLQQCVNQTVSNRIPTDLTLTNLPLFIIGDSECDDMAKLQECTINELEKCKDNTPANIVEALFRFIKRVTPCNSKPSAVRQQNLVEKVKITDKVKRSGQVDFSFIQSFQSKCKKYAGPNAFRDLETNVHSLKSCVQEHLRSTDACVRLPSAVRNCTNQVINKLRVCLPPQESYLPAFAHSSVDSVLHYICDHDGANFKRFIFSGGLTCLLGNDPKTLNDCLEGTKTRRTTDNDILTKAELCEDLDKIDLCLTTYLNNHCADMSDFKGVTVGLMEAFKSPCSGCSINLNVFVLLASTVFLFFKY